MKNAGAIVRKLSLVYGETKMAEEFRDPYQFLVAVVLSSRTRDEVTIKVAKKLFAIAPSAGKVASLTTREIESLIRGAGLFREKAKNIGRLSQMLVEKYRGKVPEDLAELMNLPGVGRKVAGVVMSQLFGRSVIAVDTHVHRITNRLGWVETEKPTETVLQLEKRVPKSLWGELNRIFVQHGQAVCLPRIPRCSRCSIHEECARRDVKRSV